MKNHPALKNELKTKLKTLTAAVASIVALSGAMIDTAAANPAVAASAAVSASVSEFQTHFKTIKVSGQDIFYREAGAKDAPTIVLLHGFPTSSHMYRNLIPKLAEKYHVIAPDYPGFGNSSMPAVDEFEYSFDNLAKITETFLNKVGVEEYSLYLMDYGAPVGFRIAANTQNEFKG